MRTSILSFWLLPVFLFSLLQTPTSAIKKQSYVVYLGGHAYGPNPTSADLDHATNSHYELLASLVGSVESAKEKIFYSYTQNINGFAAILDEEEAAELAKHPDVVSVFLNKGRELHTTRSWDFLELEKDGVIPSSSLWQKGRFGADIIIGNIDTGVWPESKSFSEEGMGPIPTRWRGNCDGVPCNRKLIGARYFYKGHSAYIGDELNSDTFKTELSARDHEGHGSHTLSIAGGNFVTGANINGNANGTAKGGSPQARVAAYKACWPVGPIQKCSDADVMAAFDAAISDGVDVISASIGSKRSEFFQDGHSIGAFHAVKKGISVVSSAGNNGPSSGTARNLSPWVFTVGASTIDREFTSYVELGNNQRLKGASLASGALSSRIFYPLITSSMAKSAHASAYAASHCLPGSLDPWKAKGKILVCLQGFNSGIEKGMQVKLVGAVGMILANDERSGNIVTAEPHLIPATHINFTDAATVFAYIESTRNPTAYITPVQTELGTKPAPIMSAFSSRGPNAIEPSILKPDITAPGENIISAFTEPVVELSSMLLSGTSFSCPHVAGIVGLLKSLHPDWSPAAIKSAIMTSARTTGNTAEPMLDSSNNQRATPFAYGAGQVNPNRAMDPGLVYDLTIDDYLNFLCAQGYSQDIISRFTEEPYTCPKSYSLADFNYPSISVPQLSGSATISRKVKNVGSPGTYEAQIISPDGVTVSVNPSTLTFSNTGEEKTFELTFKPNSNAQPTDYVFGRLIWTDGYHYVRSPLVVNFK